MHEEPESILTRLPFEPTLPTQLGVFFALDPELTPARVVELMKQGATPREGDRTFLLIDEKRSAEMLEKATPAAH